MIPENLNKFKFNEDKTNIEENLMSPKNLELVLLVSKQTKIKTNLYPYAFTFENGVYGFKLDKFVTGEDSKKYINIYNSGYNYISEESMTDNEKKEFNINYKYLKKILNDILPEKLNNGEINENRINFDKIVSLLLLSQYKGFVVFLTGPTRSGKSTLKKLIKNLVRENNFVEIGINNYKSIIILIQMILKEIQNQVRFSRV